MRQDANGLDSAACPAHQWAMLRRVSILALLLAVAPAAEARLVSQYVAGVNRVCRYENPNAGRRQTVPLVSRLIGSGEPCPIRYPSQRNLRTNAIPSMATLKGRQRVEGRYFCVYEYLGRNYSRAVTPGAACPLTPHFFN
jgi:hypothetical protein